MDGSVSNKDWQHRPPYLEPEKRREDGDIFQKKLEGTCHCGRVRYWLSRDKPLASKYCHCHDCQTMHGAPFQWAAIFHKTDMAFEHGVQDLAFYAASTKTPAHGLPCKVRCANCGSLIMDEGRNMILLFPPLLKFNRNDELKKGFDPQYVVGSLRSTSLTRYKYGSSRGLTSCRMHIFYPYRVLDIHDGKPKWAGLDKKSELIDE